MSQYGLRWPALSEGSQGTTLSDWPTRRQGFILPRAWDELASSRLAWECVDREESGRRAMSQAFAKHALLRMRAAP